MSQTTPDADSTATSGAAPNRRRGGRGLLFVLLALLALVFLSPLAVAGAVAAFLYLRPAPPLPPVHAVELPTAPESPEISSAEVKHAPPRTDEHPLDEALEIAYAGLAHMRANVHDYTATLVSRERIGGKLKDEQTMFVKIRSPKKEGDQVVTPFSVYLKFLEPKDKAGREVIYVPGQNNNKIVGHETGLFNIARYYLLPKGPVAMMGERYPIYEIGVERLTEQLIERGEEERLLDPRQTGLQVEVEKGFEFLERKCTRIALRYPEPTAEVEFHFAEIYIDEQLIVPIYYAAYNWPFEPGGEPLLEEQYTYKDLRLNVGLTDADFDPDNKEYNFP